jgi:histidine triad (HIT) family protein
MAIERFDPGCTFCAIAAGGNSDVEIIADDSVWVAFFPPQPAVLGHTLIIPRDHVADLWTASTRVVREVAVGARFVGRAIQEALSPEGMSLISSAGSAAEQTVFHLHIHVVPRWSGDGLGPFWPPKSTPEPAAFSRTAELLRAAVARLRESR